MPAVSYRPLVAIAEDVRAAVAATKAFRHTSWLACDNHRQLADYIKTYTFPVLSPGGSS